MMKGMMHQFSSSWNLLKPLSWTSECFLLTLKRLWRSMWGDLDSKDNRLYPHILTLVFPLEEYLVMILLKMQECYDFECKAFSPNPLNQTQNSARLCIFRFEECFCEFFRSIQEVLEVLSFHLSFLQNLIWCLPFLWWA